MAQVNRFVNLTGTGAVIPSGWAVIEGMYVHSTSSGAWKLWHGTTYANIGVPIMNGNVTPAVGYHNLGNILSTAGVYLQGKAGSFDVTFYIKESD